MLTIQYMTYQHTKFAHKMFSSFKVYTGQVSFCESEPCDLELDSNPSQLINNDTSAYQVWGEQVQ